MTESTPEAEPTILRKVVSGIAVATLVVAVWWFIEWRTAPPPPPDIPMPEPVPEAVETATPAPGTN